MAKVTNKQIAKAFKGAKQHLWNGKNILRIVPGITEFICYAIEYYRERGGGEYEACCAAAKVINQRLDYWSIRVWLRDVIGIPEEQLTREAVQTYRHEWLDHLIKEFSE